MDSVGSVIDRVLAARQRYSERGSRRSLEDAKRIAELAKALVRELEDAGIYSFQLANKPPRVVVDLNSVARPRRRVEIGIRIMFESEKGQAPHQSDDRRFITSREYTHSDNKNKSSTCRAT